MKRIEKAARAFGAIAMAGVLTLGSLIPVYANEPDTGAIEDTNDSAAYIPGELLVMYREDVTEEQASEIVEAQGGDDMEIISETAEGNIAVVSVADDSTVEDAMEEYLADDRVVAVTPNYEMELFGDTAVNDSLIEQQSYLLQMSVPQAWNIVSSTPHEKVKVAVLDTGADISHPDLKNVLNLSDSGEVLDNNGTIGPLQGDGYQNGRYSPDGGHGTHVSGIIAAEANNGQGIAGVGSARDNSVVDLMAVDVFSGEKTSLAYVIRGMEYARNSGAKVINMSLGMRRAEIGDQDTFFQAVCNSLASEGIIIVCAAGNYGTGDNGTLDVIPSDYDSTVSVIALNTDQTKFEGSCYGSLKDVSAPGVNIYSTVKGGTYGGMTGTSMAAPEVSGIVAMMCSVNPDLTVSEVKSILRDTATDIGTSGFDVYTAAGLVNAEKAVAAAAPDSGNTGYASLPYTDVKKGSWYYDAAAYMYEHGIMTGLSPTIFGGTGKVSRAQFATILYRMSGQAEVEYQAKFPDVQEGKFYTDAVLWAANEGIVTGYENGRFGPADSITREQMAVMLYRYVQYLGRDVSNRNSLEQFPDAQSVSRFALEAMQWANAEGIITGTGKGTLEPRADADRAACATMMMRFMKKY